MAVHTDYNAAYDEAVRAARKSGLDYGIEKIKEFGKTKFKVRPLPSKAKSFGVDLKPERVTPKDPIISRTKKEQTMRRVNEAVEGSKLIELLIQALQEGDTVRFSEYANKLISFKVSECLADHKKLIAGQMFGEDVADLVKTSNLNRDPVDNAPEEDELVPNADLAVSSAEDDQMANFEEGSESKQLDTFRQGNK